MATVACIVGGWHDGEPLAGVIMGMLWLLTNNWIIGEDELPTPFCDDPSETSSSVCCSRFHQVEEAIHFFPALGYDSSSSFSFFSSCFSLMKTLFKIFDGTDGSFG